MRWKSSPFAPSSSLAGQQENGENPLHRRWPEPSLSVLSSSYSSAPRPSSDIAPRPTTMSAVLEAIRAARERRHSPAGVQTTTDGSVPLGTTPLRTRQSVPAEGMPPQRSVSASLHSQRDAVSANTNKNTNTPKHTSVENTFSPRSSSGWGYSNYDSGSKKTTSAAAAPFGFDTVRSTAWRSPDRQAAALRQHYGFGQ